jgi:hypothetical protein
MEQGGSGFGWIIIAIGAFIVWLAWGRKKGGSSQPSRGVYVVEVPGAPARKRTNPLLVVLLFVAVIAALFWGGDWLTAHLPPAPGNRR